MSITSVSETPITAKTTAPASSALSSSAGQIQDSFMKLLVAQVENQDPTKPMTSSDMTSQMSQLNVVSGINQLNTTLSSIAGNINTNEAMQAASLIGHNVFVPGNSLKLNASGTSTMGFFLDRAAEDVQVNILDNTGSVISSQDLGEQAAGVQNLIWDGTDNLGLAANNPPYTFSITATHGGKVLPETAIKPLAVATVNNISMAGGVTNLNVTNAVNKISDVALSNIYEITN